MITQIVFKDGTEVLLGYDGVYSIIQNNVGAANETFHIYYVNGNIITVAEYDRYMSVTS